MRSDIKENTRQKKRKKNSKNKKFMAKSENLSLKAQKNNVQMKSDKTLTTQDYFFKTIQRVEKFLNETMLQVNKENDH